MMINRRRVYGGSGGDVIIMTSTSNPAVMSICYANGWCASPDFMLKSEAERVATIGNKFRGNDNITTFNEFRYFTSVTFLDDYAFYQSTITEITLPSSVKTLGSRAFQYCTNLTTINTENIESIGGLCFYGDNLLISVDLSNCVLLLDSGCQFSHCISLESLGNISNIKYIGYSEGYGTFANTRISGNLFFGSLENTVIPASFLVNCSNVTGFSSPAPYTEIKDSAFKGTKITNFKVREGCTTLNNHSFSYMNSLVLIDLPSTLTKWNGWALYDMRALTTLICRATVPPTIGQSASFTSFPAGYKVYVPSASITAYENATAWSRLVGHYEALEGSIYE